MHPYFRNVKFQESLLLTTSEIRYLFFSEFILQQPFTEHREYLLLLGTVLGAVKDEPKQTWALQLGCQKQGGGGLGGADHHMIIQVSMNSNYGKNHERDGDVNWRKFSMY